MTDDEKFDESVSNWLQREAPARLPERVLTATFERTRKSRQRVDWRSLLGSFRMPRLVATLGAATAVLLVVVVGSGLFVSQPDLGSSPSPSPAVSPSAQPTISGGMWPQSTLEEVRAAQELGDAGDSRHRWQVDPDLEARLNRGRPFSAQILTRFLAEKLGWEQYLWTEGQGVRDGEGRVVFLRCAPGVGNSVYPTDPRGGDCAPTIDEFRYETVEINIAQPARRGTAGIWVVSSWEIIEPFEQRAPPSEAEIAAVMGAFLQARIDGAGAEPFVDFADEDPFSSERVDRGIALLYATSTGAAYDRFEFEPIDAPVWPDGRMQVEVSLFAEGDTTVMKQRFLLAPDATGRLRLVYDFRPTIENGRSVPVEYRMLDGAVTYRAASPLQPNHDGWNDATRAAVEGVLPDDGARRQVLLFLADPRPVDANCAEGPAPADAASLARSLASSPRLVTTAPVGVTIGGRPALQVDVVLAPGAPFCTWSDAGRSWSSPLLRNAPFPIGADRARLFLLDLPDGSAATVLAIATVADQDSLLTVLEAAEPIVDSIEFHAR